MAEGMRQLRRLFENPPEGITPGSELDVRRFLRLQLPEQIYAGALIQHGEVSSITEAITRAAGSWEEAQRQRVE